MKRNTYEMNPSWFSESREGCRDGILGIIGISLGIAMVFGSGYLTDRRDIRKYADTNKDGLVSANEWKAVYDEIGVSNYPSISGSLSINQMESYLEKHDPSRIARKKFQEEQEMINRFSKGK